MNEHQETRLAGMTPIPVNVNHVADLARFNSPAGSDIEVIDLDNPRDEIKPTTWHG